MTELPSGILSEIGNATTLNDLAKIANSLSADAVLPNGVLSSGKLNGGYASKVAPSIANGLDWSVIDDTPRGNLLASSVFQEKITSILSIEDLDETQITEATNSFLYEAGGRSLWSQASIEFVSSLSGDILTITPNADISRIFGTDELQVALNNSKITSINRIPRSELLSIYSESGLNGVFDAVNQASANIIGTDGIAANSSNLASEEGQTNFVLTQEGASRLGINSTSYPSYDTFQSSKDENILGSSEGSNGLLNLEENPTPSVGASSVDGASGFSIGEFAPGALETLSRVGLLYDVLTSFAQASQQYTDGETDNASRTLASLAGRLYYGTIGSQSGAAFARGLLGGTATIEGAETGAEIGAAATIETGPIAVLGALVGGIIGVLAANFSVNTIWSDGKQLFNYLTGSSSSALNSGPATPLSATGQQLVAMGVPTELAGQFDTLNNTDWSALPSEQKISLSDYTADMIGDVDANQNAIPSSTAALNISVIGSVQGSSYSQLIQVFDETNAPLVSLIENGDNSFSALDYTTSGMPDKGISIDSNGNTVETVDNTSNGIKFTAINSDNSTKSVEFNSSGIPTFADAEEADGTSQITTYAEDGSSITNYYTDLNGTGAITKTEKYDTDGNITLTTLRPENEQIINASLGNNIVVGQSGQIVTISSPAGLYWGGTTGSGIYLKNGSISLGLVQNPSAGIPFDAGLYLYADSPQGTAIPNSSLPPNDWYPQPGTPGWTDLIEIPGANFANTVFGMPTLNQMTPGTVYETVANDGSRTLTVLIGKAISAVTNTTKAEPNDLFGDGSSDIIIQNSAGSLVIGQQTSTGQLSYTEAADIGPEWEMGATGDFLGSDMDNMLLHNKNSGALLIANSASGSLTYTPVGGVGSEWQFAGAGDFLGSGHDSFLMRDSTTGALVVGDAVTGNAVYTSIGGIGPEWQFEGNGNLLNDGNTGFLLRDTDSGALVVGEATNGNAAYTTIGGVGSEWEFGGTGDFLGTGHDDFLVHNENTGALVVADASKGSAAYTQIGAIGPEWQFIGTGDFSGSGSVGFMVENSNSGVLVQGTILNGQASYTQVGAIGPEWTAKTGSPLI